MSRCPPQNMTNLENAGLDLSPIAAEVHSYTDGSGSSVDEEWSDDAAAATCVPHGELVIKEDYCSSFESKEALLAERNRSANVTSAGTGVVTADSELPPPPRPTRMEDERGTELGMLRHTLSSMEERIRERDRAQSFAIAEVRNELDRTRMELHEMRMLAEERLRGMKNLEEALAEQRAEHARALRQQTLLKSLVDHWQADSMQKEAAHMSTREQMAVMDADYRVKIGQLEANLQAERRRRDELERLLLEANHTIDRLETDLAHADAGHQAIVTMLRRVQHMSVIDRLEVAVLLAVNSQRAWTAMLGPDARPLLAMAAGSEKRRLLPPGHV